MAGKGSPGADNAGQQKLGGGGGQSLAANHQPTAGLLDSVASWLMGSKIDW